MREERERQAGGNLTATNRYQQTFRTRIIIHDIMRQLYFTLGPVNRKNIMT